MSNEHTLIELLPFFELDNFIAFDLETTGLDNTNDKITEISACRFVGGDFSEEFTTLVNPEIPIPKDIISLTGITNQMVIDAPLVSDVIPDFINFIGDTPLVGHNIDFDYSFIKNNIAGTDIFLPDVPLYDTLSLARSFLYYYNNFSLGSLCDYYGIKIVCAHRAGDDAISTGKLFTLLIQEAASRPLTLIQRIDNFIKKSQVKNHKLYTDIIKTSLKLNKIDGLIQSPSDYQSPDNYFGYIGEANSSLPENPEDWFRDNGKIQSKWEEYEKRSTQIELVVDVYDTFTNGDLLVAEAGTGLGKSLAYISSGFIAAKQKKISLIISTYTKNLQDQLFSKDIPRFSECIKQDMNAVIYKGRHNYICQTRLERLLSSNSYLLNYNEYEYLVPLIIWEWDTKTGDISECNGFQMNLHKRIWSLIRSEKGFCSLRQCNKYRGCYLENIREKVEQADIIIINHFLFANELIKGNSCLPSDFNYVIDEAHHFPTAIQGQLETQVGSRTFDDVFDFFDSRKDGWKRNALNKFPDILKKYESISEKSKILKSEIKLFFMSYYENKLDDISYSEYHVNKLLYKNSEEEFIDTEPLPWEIQTAFLEYEKNLQKLGALLNENRQNIPDSIIIEYHVIERIFREGLDSFKASLDSQSDLVKWSTFNRSSYRNLTTLNSSPLNVKNFINENLLQVYSGGVFCSATLMVNDDFRYFREKIGLDLALVNRNITERNYDSPFHYNDQVKLFVFRRKININEPEFIDEVGYQIVRIISTLKKRMLILCTSFKQIRSLKNYIEPKIISNDCKLFAQASGISRNVLVRSYLEHAHSILIGTSSFWEGVDFPGDKVEILYIVKTPFDNPYEPLIQAQIEDYSQRGEDAFMQFQIPEAAMRLRQGFGRLIRNMNDMGICIIGDTRLYDRRYGEVILGSIPVDPIPYNSVELLLSESQKFFLV